MTLFQELLKLLALKSSTWLCSGNAGENSFISIGDNTVDKKYNPLSELVFHIQLLTSLPWYISYAQHYNPHLIINWGFWGILKAASF